MWAKILASRIINKSDIVDKVHYTRKPKLIQVEFKTGITEKLVCEPIKRQLRHRFAVNGDSLLDRDVPILQQYELDPLDQQDQQAAYHHIINRADWELATVPEQRIAYHRILLKLYESINVRDYYPRSQRKHDYLSLCRDKPERFMHQGKFYTYPAGTNLNTPWRRMAEHFFNVSPTFDREVIDHALSVTSRMVKVDISTYEVRKRAARFAGNSRAYSPVAYRAIMERLGVKDTVIDLHPDLGHKAIACAMLGIKYICPKTETFQAAIDLGFADELGLYHEWLDGQEAHTIISDNNFHDFKIQEALGLADKAKMLLSYASSTERLDVANKYKPDKTYIIMRSRHKAPGFLMVW